MKLVEFNRAEPGINRGQQRVLEDGFADKLAAQGKVTVLKEGPAVFEQEHAPERAGPPTRRKQTRAKTAA
ncbi:MAG TPA: hypothetical protein VGR45_00665 [Stellaceae bacterium]|nr:hypothetical protein [Stellaceae bacterium]